MHSNSNSNRVIASSSRLIEAMIMIVIVIVLAPTIVCSVA